MVDQAQVIMANGGRVAIEQLAGVNDNMSKSHYHEYYELYFLDSGERHHILDSSIYDIKAGNFMLFEPLTMHHSYGDKDVAFSRIVLYFTEDAIQYEGIRKFLHGGSGVYRPDVHAMHNIRRFLYSLMQEQSEDGDYHEEKMMAFLNVLLMQFIDMKPSK